MTPSARRPSRSTTATIWGNAAKRASVSSGRSAATTTARRSESPEAARVAGGHSAERGGDRTDERATPIEGQPASRARHGRGERPPKLRLRRRADPRHPLQVAAGDRGAQLGGRLDVECPRQLDRACRREAEQAAEADDLRQHLPLELAQLGDLARLDQLAQPCLDRRADPAQLADTPRADELRHRRCREADQLGR
ncbi:MAG TPA: hypothetical protein VFI37_06855, partial [Gaiellaceae bacterium]|nr:hypothetical protein [Gaiellaceae bacterium]